MPDEPLIRVFNRNSMKRPIHTTRNNFSRHVWQKHRLVKTAKVAKKTPMWTANCQWLKSFSEVVLYTLPLRSLLRLSNSSYSTTKRISLTQCSRLLPLLGANFKLFNLFWLTYLKLLTTPFFLTYSTLSFALLNLNTKLTVRPFIKNTKRHWLPLYLQSNTLL